MNFRSYADLQGTLARWQEKLPRDFTIVCGLPRSGLMVANLLALQWNIPLADPDGLLAGRLLGAGRRLAGFSAENSLQQRQKVLVVDDSVCGGETMRRAKLLLDPITARHDLKFAAVYAAREKCADVDFAAETLASPRVFEWNLFHHPLLAKSCMDIDGVLCSDPTPEQNDDGPRYRKFLSTVAPRHLPTVEVGWLVTSRLEKYRSETEEWLRRHGVRYRELCMLDLPDMATRRSTGAGVTFKVGQYRRTGARLFVESDTRQAAEIAQRAGNHVIATDGMQMLSPGGVNGQTLRVRQEISARAHLVRTWRGRVARFCRRCFA